MNTYIPFVYLLTFLPTGQLYIGSRSRKNCHPADLWTKYFSSSGVVCSLIKEHGKDFFLYEIRKTFTTKLEALAYETRFLKRVDAKNNKKFLNQTNGDHAFTCNGHTSQSRKKISLANKNRSQEINDKISAALTGVKRPQDVKDKISVGNKGKKRSEPMSTEQREKISKETKGVLKPSLSLDNRNKISLSKKGVSTKPCSEETKRKISSAQI